jgi:hypothetical protein
MASITAVTPNLDNWSSSSEAFALPLISKGTDVYTGPVSIPASSLKTVTPVDVSPASSARCTGAAPLQRGNKEKCRFINPFLGTHFTITTDGQVKIGPTAQPVLFSEQYSVKAGWNRDEFVKVPIAIKSYLSNNFGNISSLVISEFPQLFERGLLKKSAQLVPSARKIKTWQRKPSGIRAQLLRNDTNNLEQDFVVEGDAESTHLLNIVSPGWTSSLSFADWVAKKHVIQHL